ncbi:amidohydrolase family protein [Yinghuangia seranimata]|uniref:amidohydrolase family protein n=1 Tax=Yinghuangia seranimata TaxID=408067 RepID=UPI00248D28A6|nr:amidohydrolase family protein [Yinghuangia seranimata]MDI2127014.1 amidohydrolase family protein [Yinghuangia seranimata]
MPLTVHAAPVVLTMTGDDPARDGVLRDAAVAVDGDRIAGVGPVGEVAGRFPDARVRRWPGVITPGLVNAHAHLQYTDFAHLASSGLPFPEWLLALNRERAGYTEARWQESARRGVHLMLKSGTTAVADVVTHACVLVPVARSGIRGVSYIEVLADDAAWAAKRRDRFFAALDTPVGRTLGVSPHTPYSVGSAVFRELVAVARERGLRMHPHLAESADEVEFVRSGTGSFADVHHALGTTHELLDAGSGLAPGGYLDTLGALGPDVHVAHGVHLDAADRALLRERGTAVALCVRSNATLKAGEAPVADYLTEGSPLALGTDSLASGPSLDLWEEASAVRELALRQGYTAPDLDARLVTAATLGGAQALGLPAAGHLTEGGPADLAVFKVPTDLDPHTSLITHGAGSCVGTVLGGRLVHRR